MLLSRNCLAYAVCGLSVAFGLTKSDAAEPVVQQFGDWKITIQPGFSKSDFVVPPSPRAELPIRWVSQTDQFPAITEETTPMVPVPPAPEQALPPAPHPAGHEQNSTAAAEKTPALLDSPVITPCRSHDPLATVALYSQVYNSIPFSRAEYEANPSYRHDATMEFLFGQMRNTVIQRNRTTIQQHTTPAMSPVYPSYSPYGFNSYSYPFYNGYGNFPYRAPALW